MKERPIIFTGPMVRAILDGRKTQTRRVIKPQPPGEPIKVRHKRWGIIGGEFYYCGIRCPYGVPEHTHGEATRLWVRETWREVGSAQRSDGRIPPDLSAHEVVYAADGKWEGPWRPSIHMPRNASRLLLEIESIGVERVQEISREDALAEGIYSELVNAAAPERLTPAYVAPGVPMFNCFGEEDHYAPAHNSAVGAFECLWNSINAKRGLGWEDNPWVWVIKFKVLQMKGADHD